jgi:hypothetical protein
MFLPTLANSVTKIVKFVQVLAKMNASLVSQVLFYFKINVSKSALLFFLVMQPTTSVKIVILVVRHALALMISHAFHVFRIRFFFQVNVLKIAHNNFIQI